MICYKNDDVLRNVLIKKLTKTHENNDLTLKIVDFDYFHKNF